MFHTILYTGETVQMQIPTQGALTTSEIVNFKLLDVKALALDGGGGGGRRNVLQAEL